MAEQDTCVQPQDWSTFEAPCTHGQSSLQLVRNVDLTKGCHSDDNSNHTTVGTRRKSRARTHTQCSNVVRRRRWRRHDAVRPSSACPRASSRWRCQVRCVCCVNTFRIVPRHTDTSHTHTHTHMSATWPCMCISARHTTFCAMCACTQHRIPASQQPAHSSVHNDVCGGRLRGRPSKYQTLHSVLSLSVCGCGCGCG
jgi:hypothetical protein